VLWTRRKRRDQPDFKGEKNEVAVRYENGKTLILCGVGRASDLEPHITRTASANGIRRALALGRSEVSVRLPDTKRYRKGSWEAALEGCVLGAYAFDKYVTDKKKRRSLKSLELVSGRPSPSDLRKALAVCEGVNHARDLVNDNASVVTPAYLAAEAKRIARSGRMRVTVLDEKAIDRQGLGLLKAVGQGSPFPARLVILEYNGAPKSRERTAVVGKGITFDSGGQNLKPSGGIETMRCDMAGAAAVLGLMKAVGAVRPKVNLLGVVAAAHNALDGRSYFPGDVYTSYSGKTVEISNTDAEGRLVLGDAIAYCNLKKKPTRIVDLATLTGGVLIALGPYVAGLVSNDDTLSKALFDAGERTRERLWRLPLYDEYRKAMDGDRADVQNLPKLKRGHASTITGAAFIEKFVDDTPWAHLDIAGVAFNPGEPRGEVPKHATGFGVRLLMDCLRTWSGKGR
jgi:leucyl aminopeptidase